MNVSLMLSKRTISRIASQCQQVGILTSVLGNICH